MPCVPASPRNQRAVFGDGSCIGLWKQEVRIQSQPEREPPAPMPHPTHHP